MSLLESVDEVVRAWESGRFALTIELAQALHREDPGSWSTHYCLGDALAFVGRHADAIAALTEAPAHSTEGWCRAHAAERIGRIHQDRGELPAAEERYRRAVDLCPSSARYLTTLARLLESDGRPEEARAALEAAAERPGHERDSALCELGLMDRRQRRYGDAERHLARALEIDPEHAPARSALRDVEAATRCGDVAFETRVARAEELGTTEYPATCRELVLPVLAERPGDTGACLAHVHALRELRLFPEARAAVEVLRGRGCREDVLEFWLGAICRDMRDHEGAERAFLRARDARPRHADPLIQLAAMWLDMGSLDAAELVAREAAEAETGCIDEAHHFLGLVLRGMGRHEEALASFRRAIEMDPDYAVAKQCAADLEEVLRRFPSRSDTSPG